jgi:hypothetical protein
VDEVNQTIFPTTIRPISKKAVGDGHEGELPQTDDLPEIPEHDLWMRTKDLTGLVVRIAEFDCE